MPLILFAIFSYGVVLWWCIDAMLCIGLLFCGGDCIFVVYGVGGGVDR